MGAFEDFVTLELPRRPWVLTDGQPGQVLMRVQDVNKRLGLEWKDLNGSIAISTDAGNALRRGSDDGLFVGQFEWTSTQW